MGITKGYSPPTQRTTLVQNYSTCLARLSCHTCPKNSRKIGTFSKRSLQYLSVKKLTTKGFEKQLTGCIVFQIYFWRDTCFSGTDSTAEIVFFRRHPACKSGKPKAAELARVCDLSRTTVYKYLSLLEGERKTAPFYHFFRNDATINASKDAIAPANAAPCVPMQSIITATTARIAVITSAITAKIACAI